MTNDINCYVMIECPRCHSGIRYNDSEEMCVDCEYEFEKEDFVK